MFQEVRKGLKRFYVVIICQILALILFMVAHFLISIYYYSGQYDVYGYIDLSFFGGIAFQIISIVLVISLYVDREREWKEVEFDSGKK